MPDPARLRDSTQIVLPCELLDGMREELQSEFTITIYTDDDADREEELCQIIASPVEIRHVADYLTRHGISVR
jgi:hypothetical protein